MSKPEQTVRVELRNLNALLDLLDVNVNVVLQPVFWGVVTQGLREFKTYPAPRPGSTYERRAEAGGLKGSWTGTVVTDRRRIIARFTNPREYAPYVQADREQAWMHRGRWDTDVKIVQRLIPLATQGAVEALEGEWRKRSAANPT